MFKRILSMLLSIVMVISLLPVSAFAESAMVGEVVSGGVVGGEVGGVVPEVPTPEVSGTVTVSTQDDLDAVIMSGKGFDYLQSDILITGDVTYNGYGLKLQPSEGAAGKEITIANGGCLTVSADYLYILLNATITVEEGGQLVIQSGTRTFIYNMGSVYVKSGGYLTAEFLYVTEGGYLAADFAKSLNVGQVFGSPGAEFSSAVEGLVSMSDIVVSSTEELKSAVAKYANYANVTIVMGSSFTLTESVALPGNAYLSIGLSYVDGVEVYPVLTVAEGVTLTANPGAWLSVDYGGHLLVEAGGGIVNRGGMYVYDQGSLTMNTGASFVGEVNIESGAIVNDPSGVLNIAGQEKVRLFARWSFEDSYLDSSEIYLNSNSPLVFCFGTTEEYIVVTDLTSSGGVSLDGPYSYGYDGALCYYVGVNALGEGTVSYTHTDGTVYTYFVQGMLGYPGDLVAQKLDGTGEIVPMLSILVGETVDVKFYQLDSYTTYHDLPADVTLQADDIVTLEKIEGGYRIGVTGKSEEYLSQIYYVDANYAQHNFWVEGTDGTIGGGGENEEVRLFARWDFEKSYMDSSEIYLNSTSPLVFCFGTTQDHIFVTDLTTSGVATLDGTYTAFDGAPYFEVGISGLGEGTVSYTHTDGTVYTYSVQGILGYPGDLIARNIDGTGDFIPSINLAVGETVDVKFYQLDSYTTYHELPADVALQADGIATVEKIAGGYRVGVTGVTENYMSRIFYMDANKQMHSIWVFGYEAPDDGGNIGGGTTGGDNTGGNTGGGTSGGGTSGGGTTGGDSGDPEGGNPGGEAIVASNFAELVAASVAAGYEDIYVMNDITVTADYDLKGMSVYVRDGATLTVAQGVTLTVDQYVMAGDGSAVVVEMGAILQIAHEKVEPGNSYSSAGLRINGGTVRVEEGGTLAIPDHDEFLVNSGTLEVYGALLLQVGHLVDVYYCNGAEIYGLDVEGIKARVKVHSDQEIREAQAEYGTYGVLVMYAVGEFAIEDDLSLLKSTRFVIDGSEGYEANVTLARDAHLEINGEFSVWDGGLFTADRWTTTLMNEGSRMVVGEDGTVHIKVTAHLINDGGRIVVYDDYNGKLIIDGDFANRDEQGLNGTVSKNEVKTVEDYHALMSANNGTITITEPFVFTEQPNMYSSNVYITIAEGGSITLAGGVTWRVAYGAATITVDGGELILGQNSYLDYSYYGGKYKWVNDLWIESGRLEVGPGATLDMLGDLSVNLDGNPDIYGIHTSLWHVSKTCNTEEELRAMLENPQGFASVSVTMNNKLDLYQDLEIPEGVTVNFSGGVDIHQGALLNNWGYVSFQNSDCNIYAGGQLQNNGRLNNISYSDAGIVVQPGGKLQNNDTLYIAGFSSVGVTVKSGAMLRNDGTISGSSGILNIYGILTGNGEIDSYGVTVNDYREPEEEGVTSVYTVEELEQALADGAAEIAIKYNMVLNQALTVVDSLIRIDAGVVVTNNSCITMEDNGSLVVSGTFINNQTVDVMGGVVHVTGTGILENQNNVYVNDGTVDVEGAWEGMNVNVNLLQPEENLNVNAPGWNFVASVYSLEELLAVLEQEQVQYGAGVTINVYNSFVVTGRVEIPAHVQLFVISGETATEVTVADNAELILYGPAFFNDAKLTVQEGGVLANYFDLTINNLPNGLGGATLDGQVENYGTLWVNTGSAVTVSDILFNFGSLHVGFGGEENPCTLNISGMLDNYGYFNVTHDGIVNVTNRLANSIWDGAHGFMEVHGQMNVSGALVNVSDNGIFLEGTLVVTGEYSGEGPLALNVRNESLVLEGVGDANFQYHYSVYDAEQLQEALDYAASCDRLHIDHMGYITLEEPLELPENVVFNNYGTIELCDGAELMVNNRLYNEGQITVKQGSTLGIYMNAVLANNGAILVQGGSVYVVGTYTSDFDAAINMDIRYPDSAVHGEAPVVGGSFITSFDELAEALAIIEEGYQGRSVTLNVTDTVILEDVVTIPANVRIFVAGSEEQDVNLIVPSGAALLAQGNVVLRDAELIVEEDGSVEFYNELSFEIRNSDTCGAVLNGDMINYGTITIGEGVRMEINGYACSEGEIYVNRNGCLEIHGELSNLGYIEVEEHGEINVIEGTLGNAHGRNQDGYILMKGFMSASGSIEIDAPMEIHGQLMLDPDGRMIVNKTELTIGENGELVVNGELFALESGICNNGALWVNTDGEAYLDEQSVLWSYNCMFVGFGPEDETYQSNLEINGRLENYGYFHVEPKGYVTVNGELNNHSTDEYFAYMEMQGQLYVEGTMCHYSEATITGSVLVPGRLENYGHFNVDGGTLNVYGDYIDYGVITHVVNNGGAVMVPGNAYVQKLYRAETYEELHDALVLADTLDNLDVEVTAGFRIEENLVIPENVYLSLNGLEQDVCITVAQGYDLWVNGGIRVNGGTKLVVEPDAVLYNYGHIQVDGGSVIVEGDYESKDDREIQVDFYNGGQVLGAPIQYQVNVDDSSQLAGILRVVEDIGDTKLVMNLFNGFTIEEDICIPENVFLYIGNWNWVSIAEGVTVDNYGYIEIRDESVLHNAGILNNYGTLIVRESCALENEGELNGNPPEIDQNGQDDVYVVVESEEELRAALENDRTPVVVLQGEVVLSEDLVIVNKSLIIQDGGFLTVPDGFTLVLESGNIQLNQGGILHVEEGAALYNFDLIFVDGGALQVLGAYEYSRELYYVVSNETSFVYIAGDANICHVFRAASYYDLIAAAAIASGYDYLDVEVINSITISSNLTIPENVHVAVYGNVEEVSEVVVRSGVTLTVNGGLYLGDDSQLTIMSHATLKNNGNINVSGGVVDVQGEYVSDSDRVITLDLRGGDIINAPFRYQAYVDSFELLFEVLHYIAAMDMQEPVELDVYEWFNIWESITIPENVTINLGNGWDMAVLIPEGITVTNYGTLRVCDGSMLVVDGVMDNQGNLIVDIGSSVVINGEITGNEPAEDTFSFQDLMDQIACGVYWNDIDSQLVIEEDWVLERDWGLELLEGAEIVVPEGVTLVIEGGVNFYGGGITVQEGGHLVLNQDVELMDAGFVHVDGSCSGNGTLFVDLSNDQFVSVYGVSESRIFGTSEVSSAMAMMVLTGAGYRGLSLKVVGDVVLDENLTLGNENLLEIYEGGSLTVSSGATLTLDCYLDMYGGSLIVDEGATLVNNKYLYVNAGVVDINGTYSGDGAVGAYYGSNTTLVEGIDPALMEIAIESVTDEETLRWAMESGYASVILLVTSEITLTKDLKIPENYSVFIALLENVAAYSRRTATVPCIRVPAGMTLTVEGALCNYGQLIIEEEAKLVNEGQITVQAGTVLENKGTYSGSGLVDVDYSEGTIVEGVDNSSIRVDALVFSYEELAEILDAGYAGGNLSIHGEVVVTEDVTIDESFHLYLGEGGAIMVQENAHLTIGGEMEQSDLAIVIVSAGATMELLDSASYNLMHGALIVEEDATFLGNGNVAFIWGQVDVIGVNPRDLSMVAFVWDGESMEQALAGTEDYVLVHLMLDMGWLELDRDITLNPNTMLTLEGTRETPRTLYLQENVTLTNKGTIVLGEYGKLEVQSQGTLINAGEIRMEGGELIQNENGDIWEENPVAKIGDVEYTSLMDALKAAKSGDVVQLIADVAVDGTVSIPVGVTLNLADYALTADYIIGFNGSYLTGTPEIAKLNVPKDQIILGKEGYKNEKGQYVLPIWDPANGCFLFSLFVANTATSARGLYLYEDEGKIFFQFKHQATTALNNRLLSDGAGDNGLSIVIRLKWTNSNGTACQDFYYNDRQIGLVTGKNDYTFTLTGYSALNIDLSTLVVQALIISDSGAIAYGTEWTQANAK